jgi:hypothetical protein
MKSKSDLSTGGLLSKEQSENFVKVLMEHSSMLRKVRKISLKPKDPFEAAVKKARCKYKRMKRRRTLNAKRK